MLSANQFLNQVYLKEASMNQHDFCHTDIDSIKVKGGLQSWAWLKKLAANQILRFINQVYLKSNCVTQCGFLHVDIK